jgi:hypothetical protein
LSWSSVVRFDFDSQEAIREGYHGRIGGVYEHEALYLSAVKEWHKQLVNSRITMEDHPWSGRPTRSDLCEFLRALIDETPFIPCKHMSQKLWIPKTTCLRVLREDHRFKKCSFRWWVPHSMMKSEAQCWVTFSEEFLQVVRHAKETNSEHLLTGNES